ncbi:MAG: hypothetical protein LC126_17690 [Bryobacterales bacterium]|nr:hypothetical protein [Bryobacterales bacterium]
MKFNACSVMMPILFAVMACQADAASKVKWGAVTDGLQLGIDSSTPSGKSGSVRVVLKNVSTETRDLVIGFEGPSGPIYAVKLAAVSRRGSEEYSVFDLNALKAQPGGLPKSSAVRLQAGSEYTFMFPLDRLICVIERKDTPLRTLLTQAFTVRASFDSSGATVVSGDLVPE